MSGLTCQGLAVAQSPRPGCSASLSVTGLPALSFGSEPLGSIAPRLSSFPLPSTPAPPCPAPHCATMASATGIETGPVVLKHPASEAEIQPQTQVTLRCHIDGHPR